MRTSKITNASTAIEMLVMGPIDNNVYVIDDGAGGVVIVDPTDRAQDILRVVGSRKVSGILLTHCHWDHVGAAAPLRAQTGAKVYCGDADADEVEHPTDRSAGVPAPPCKVDRRMRDGYTFKTGALEWECIATPGHTPGGMCYLTQGTRPGAAPVLVAGDTLFCAGVGRTDFAGGSMRDMRASLRKLGRLADNTLVLPGHGPLTTIGDERTRVIEALS